MSTDTGTGADTEQPTRALLALIEADRAQQCATLLGEAQRRAAALRRQAAAEARARLREVFAEQRQRRREQIAAAQARLATRRRLHEHRRVAALLRLAWETLPDRLRSLWQQGDSRAAWADRVATAALAQLPHGAWRIVHAPDWTAAEQQALAQRIAGAAGAAPRFEADAAIVAGLKVMADGNVVDGSLDGLLADRAELEARLLHLLEASQ
ncbi:hypothetical protein [uncultured Piscinibacter sp.]|uniref:hypothetical protein n=1 Tax=uncultured Piscinibacter sp. TaxID=1131835 RepID=UPI002624B0AC|nr:hypothetical protein [uncultured Piscinibacter sp.]